MQRWQCFSIFTLLILCSISARAFHLDDHERVTQQAYAEFVNCFPRFQNQLNLSALVQANKDEDLDLIEKEVFYSHFYNPHKALDLWWRKDSAARVENLAPALAQCRASGAAVSDEQVSALGHTIHQFQDMAVPAHVVPVNHALWDGFESLVITSDLSSGWSCAQIVDPKGDLQSILQETAEKTLQAIAGFSAVATRDSDHTQAQILGLDFWQESEDSSFGHYGSVGNSFGSSQIEVGEDSYQVQPDVYRLFKQQQMQLAVQATLHGLAWTLKP